MCIVLSFVIICVSLMSFRQLTLKLTLKDSLDESSCIFVCHMLTAFSMKGAKAAKGGKTFKSRARNERCALSIYQKIKGVKKYFQKIPSLIMIYRVSKLAWELLGKVIWPNFSEL